MLSHLSIQAIALIDRLELDLPSGLLVITGETGAGKSIVIDSVNLVLGERADRGLIQTGQSKAVVEAVFDSLEAHTLDQLHSAGIEVEEGQLILSRELTSNGKNTCRLNGRLSNLSTLKEASDLLVDLHGQHEHQNLLRAANHLVFLDAFGGKSIEKAYATYSKSREKWKSITHQLQHEIGSDAERTRQRDVLCYQINEIEQAHLQPGEEEALRDERTLLSNIERIQTTLHQSLSALEGDDEMLGALALQKTALDSFQSISSLNADYEKLFARLSEAYYDLEDIASDLRHAADIGDFDPYRYDEVEKRLELIHALERKYGADIPAVLAFYEQSKKQLNELDLREELARRGEAILREQEQYCYEHALQLHKARTQAAQLLETQLQAQFADLAMERAQFSVHFEEWPAQAHGMTFPITGLDKVEFLIATNPGEPRKPLQKIVSGGELSRIMLAFKTISAQILGCETLIFDEIDTGISGATAYAVGQKMHDIARTRQVICVTHSPQIVAFADHHLRIAKNDIDGQSKTSVTTLNEEQHARELARLISGNEPGESALQHARDLIQSARGR